MRAIKNIRLKAYDYRDDGYYFVTIVCDHRADLFKGKEDLVKQELRDLEAKTSGFTLDFFVVMPNHIHIILILQKCGLGLGEIVRRFKAKVSKVFGSRVWQPNYYEHVIRNEKALNIIRQYILDNPEQLLLEFKQFYA